MERKINTGISNIKFEVFGEMDSTREFHKLISDVIDVCSKSKLSVGEVLVALERTKATIVNNSPCNC